MPRHYLSQADNVLNKIDPESYDRVVFVLHDQLNLSAWPGWVMDQKPLLIFIESRKKGMSFPITK